MRNFIFRAEELKGPLTELRENGVSKGAWTGFTSLFDKYSMKKGSTTYIYAGAHQGKSQFGFEIMMNLAEYSGWKWAIYSPETGSPTEVFAELLWVYLRKPFLVNDRVTASDEESQRAIDFINEHFYIIDSGLNDLTVEGFYNCVSEIEQEVRIDGCFIDPFTEIKTDVSAGVRDDIAIGQVLTKIRKHSSDNNYHTVVTVHTKHQQAKYKSGIPYVDKPTMNDIAGGMQWSRKGMMIINVWRCPYGLEDSNGVPYEPNQVEITIVKAKPKIVGKLGSVTLYYDKVRNRYYEIDELGNKRFAYPDPDKPNKIPTPTQEELEF
jgi:twinkle protein